MERALVNGTKDKDLRTNVCHVSPPAHIRFCSPGISSLRDVDHLLPAFSREEVGKKWEGTDARLTLLKT